MKDNTPRSVFIIVRWFVDAQTADESGMFSSVPIWELWRVARTNMAAPLTCGRAANEASRYLLCLWGERLVEHCTLQNRVFLYHCISDGNRLFSENDGCHFHFILHVMSDKSAFVSGALFCVQRYRGNLDHYNSASRWQIIHLHIYAATNSVTLWDYGINKFNCITVSLQFML